MEFFDGVFNRQTVAVPAGDVLRIKTGELAAFDDHVFQYFVQRVADVQFAIRIRRAVVQHKEWLAVARHAQLFVKALVCPAFGPCRFTLGQVATHGKRCVRQVQGGAVIGGVCVGHVNSVSRYSNGFGIEAAASGAAVSGCRRRGARCVMQALSNSGGQPGACVIAVALYAPVQGVQAVVFQFVV